MIKTFKELKEVDNLVGTLFAKNPTLRDSKFGYAYKRFVQKNFMPVATEFNEALVAVRVDCAMEDPITKEVLADPANPRGFKYDKTGLKQVMFEESLLVKKWDELEIEVTPYLSPMIPEGLTEEETAILAGLVLPLT